MLSREWYTALPCEHINADYDLEGRGALGLRGAAAAASAAQEEREDARASAKISQGRSSCELADATIAPPSLSG